MKIEAHRKVVNEQILYVMYRVDPNNGRCYRYASYASLDDAVSEANWLMQHGEYNSPHIIKEQEISY